MLKQKQKKSSVRFTIAIFIAVSVIGAVSGAASALARSYSTTDTSIKTGMVVATVSKTTDTSDESALVQKASQANGELAVGVVTDVNASDVSFAENGKGEVLVANTGQVSAYVSDINGVPKSGDLLVPSQLEGILMRAEKNNSGVIGVAVSNFPENATSYPLKDGKSAKIAVILVNMDIHPVSAKPQNVIQEVASRIVGHDVTLVQTIIAGAIFLMTIVIVGATTYGAVVNYMSSLGRNPLGKGVLRKGLLRILVLVLAVLVIGIAVSWVVLWL